MPRCQIKKIIFFLDLLPVAYRAHPPQKIKPKSLRVYLGVPGQVMTIVSLARYTLNNLWHWGFYRYDYHTPNTIIH